MKLGQMQEIVSELCKLYGQLDSVNKAIIAFTDEQLAGWKSPLRVAKGEARYDDAYVSYREDNVALRNLPDAFRGIFVMALREGARQLQAKIDDIEVEA